MLLRVRWVQGAEVGPGGDQKGLQTIYHLREEHQSLGVVLNCFSDALGGSGHLLPEELDVFSAALHGAGGQLDGGPQLVQALLLGELDGGVVQETVRVHGARWSSVDTGALKPSGKTWVEALNIWVVWNARTWSTCFPPLGGGIRDVGRGSCSIKPFHNVVSDEKGETINP